MNDIDYGKYLESKDINELKEILKMIDKEKYQNRYEIVEAKINQIDPEVIQELKNKEKPYNKIEIIDNNYRKIVLFSIIGLLFYNTINLLLASYFSIIPIVIQVALLVAMLKSHKSFYNLMRIWTILIFIGWLSTMFGIFIDLLQVSLGESITNQKYLKVNRIIIAIVFGILSIYLLKNNKKAIKIIYN